MCSRYTLISKPVLIARRFGLQEIDPFPARYSIAPTQPVGIIRIGYNKQREFVLVRWGLIPDWVKDPGDFTTLVNARSETLAEKPSFRNALKYRRCLFPIDGFYEWSGGKGERQPYYISASNEEPMGVAGLWENWMGVDGSEMESAVIITTNANGDISRVHKRAPVVITPDNYDRWLDCLDGTGADTADLLKPAAPGFFKLKKISTKVNNPAYSGEELLEPVGQQELF